MWGMESLADYVRRTRPEPDVIHLDKHWKVWHVSAQRSSGGRHAVSCRRSSRGEEVNTQRAIDQYHRGGPRNSDSYVRWIQPLYGRTGDMGKRRSFSAQFKAKVALEALVGDQTLAELAAKHHLHPNVIAQWKRQARESLPEVFARKTSSRAADHEAEVKALHAKIGQLTVENDFLSRAFGR